MVLGPRGVGVLGVLVGAQRGLERLDGLLYGDVLGRAGDTGGRHCGALLAVPAALQDRVLSTLLPLLGSPQLTGAVKLVPGGEPSPSSTSPSRVLVTSSTLVLVVVTMLLLLLALVPRPPTSPRIRDHPLLPVPVLRVRGPRVRRLRRLLRAAPRDLLHPAVAAAAVARLGLSSG